MGALDIHHGGRDNNKTIPLINADTRGLKALTTENAEERREKSGRSVAVRKVDDGRRKKKPIGWHSCIRIFFVGFVFLSAEIRVNQRWGFDLPWWFWKQTGN